MARDFITKDKLKWLLMTAVFLLLLIGFAPAQADAADTTDSKILIGGQSVLVESNYDKDTDSYELTLTGGGKAVYSSGVLTISNVGATASPWIKIENMDLITIAVDGSNTVSNIQSSGKVILRAGMTGANPLLNIQETANDALSCTDIDIKDIGVTLNGGILKVNTLRLENANIAGEVKTADGDGLTIETAGTNQITSNGGVGISVGTDLYIKANSAGTFSIISGHDGIVAPSSLKIENGALDLKNTDTSVNNAYTGIKAEGTVEINGATIGITGYGQDSISQKKEKSFKLKNNSTITAEYVGASVIAGNFDLENSSLIVREKKPEDGTTPVGTDKVYTVTADNITVVNGRIVANTDANRGIWSDGILKVSGKNSAISGIGDFVGIGSQGAMTLSEAGSVIAECTAVTSQAGDQLNGIWCGDKLTITEKANVSAEGYYTGIRVVGDMVIDSGATITKAVIRGNVSPDSAVASDATKFDSTKYNGIWCGGTLKALDRSTVTAASGYYAGIRAEENMTLDDADITAESIGDLQGTADTEAFNGISCEKELRISSNSDVKATAKAKESNGIRGKSIIISDKAKVTAKGETAGVWARDGGLIIEGTTAQVTATGTSVSEKIDSSGIYSKGPLAIKDTVTVIAVGKSKANIWGKDVVDLSGGTITADGEANVPVGILSEGILTVSGKADIKAKGTDAGIKGANGKLNFTGGKTDAKATAVNSAGIWSPKELMINAAADIIAEGQRAGIYGMDSTNISGGTITAKGIAASTSSVGILTEGQLIIDNNGEAIPKITAEGQRAGIEGIGEINLFGGITDAKGLAATDSYGLLGNTKLIIAKNAEIAVNGKDAGILAKTTLDCLGASKVTADGKNGIRSEGKLTTEGGTELNVHGAAEAIYGEKQLDLFSGTIDAVSDKEIGVFSKQYITMGAGLSIHAKGGTIKDSTGTTQESAKSAVEVVYEKTKADELVEPKIECDTNLMPRGYKIGVGGWFDDKFSRTSFISEFAENLPGKDVPGFPEIDFVAIAPGSASKPNITKDLDDIKDSKTYTQYATNVQALHIEAEHGDINDKGILTYQWFYKENENDENGILIPDAKEASYVPSTAELGTRWYYCVVTNTNDSATDVKVQRTTSMMAKITIIPATDAAKPIITTDLSDREVVYVKDGAGAASLKVKGQAPDSGKVTYQWYVNNRQSVAGGTLIERAEKSSYKPSVADVGTKYYYCVVTNYNDKVSGKKSEEQTSKVAKITVCLRPDTPQAKLAATTDKSVKISWSAVRGAKGYYIYRCSTSKNGMYSRVGSTKAGTRHWTNTGRTTGKTYYYKVRAYKMQGSTTVTSLASSAVAATPRRAAPTFKLTPGNNSMKVSWSKSSGADGYSVYRATSKKGTYKLIKTVKGNTTRSYTSKKLKDKKTYYYKMRSYKMSGKTKVYSKYSAIKSAKTK